MTKNSFFLMKKNKRKSLFFNKNSYERIFTFKKFSQQKYQTKTHIVEKSFNLELL